MNIVYWLLLIVVLGIAIRLHLWLHSKKWEPGRQDGGYFKLSVLDFKYFDCYLLRFPQGSFVGEHIDPIEYGNHFRLNIELAKAKKGGEFKLEGDPIWHHPPFVLFRSDVQKHSVSRIEEGYRLVLSFGVVIPNAS